MAPVNDHHPRNTGTVPKSNRRNDRNRERSFVNQQLSSRCTQSREQQSQLPNNLFQLDYQPVNERDFSRVAKNSNTRTTSASSLPFFDISEFALSHNSSNQQHNYITEEGTLWQKMIPPTNSRAQSPPPSQGTKSTNVDKMPDRNQMVKTVESRLNQIRDYIKTTSTMMESLNQSSDPRARTQHEKLGRMVEDLYDSESKLAKLLTQYRSHGNSDENEDGMIENGDENLDESRATQLRKKMEDSQKKIAQLQEHQAQLVGMQLAMTERLNEARQLRRALLLQEPQESSVHSTQESGSNHLTHQVPMNADQLESETVALRGKLAQLQNKKKNMDHLVAELQAAEMSDRGSCSSESSRNMRDKATELEVLKAQLAHLKLLMEGATRARDSLDVNSEPEREGGMNNDAMDDESLDRSGLYNSYDNFSDNDDVMKVKKLEIDQIQAVTRELKEQSILLQSARAELIALKQSSSLCSNQAAASSSLSGSTPPPLVTSGFSLSEKKHSNNNTLNNINGSSNEESQQGQNKRWQLEELMRKDQSRLSSVNQNTGGDWSSRRGSQSLQSHNSTPANLWPPPVPTVGPNERNIDGLSTSEHLLDIGPQGPIENGYAGNWWGLPVPPVNQQPHGVIPSAEYYRQLLLGSQAHQLQMMSTTIQNCCQLLWTQQREMQSMRSAIGQLQQQLRQFQLRERVPDSQEEYSNLNRFGNGVDSALPPSSSLPNLVSLPNSSPAPPIVISSTAQQQQQQLNNQVPPGNRANNYWDNFRSYSRQNLLSGSAKTVTDSTATTSANTSGSATTASGGVHNSLSERKDKQNREQVSETLSLPSALGAESQYSLNLQLSSNLQQHEREVSVARNNILSNDTAQQSQGENIWDETLSSYRMLPGNSEDHTSFDRFSGEMKDTLHSLVAANQKRPDYLISVLKKIRTISEDEYSRLCLLRSLRSLQNAQSPDNPLNEVTDQTASECDTCQSSEEESEIGAQASAILSSANDNQSSLAELLEPLQPHSTSPTSITPAICHFELPIVQTVPFVNTSAMPSMSSMTPGYNEDLAEADQSRPEASNQQLPHPPLQISIAEESNEREEGEQAVARLQTGNDELQPVLEDSNSDNEDEKIENGDGTVIKRKYLRVFINN